MTSPSPKPCPFCFKPAEMVRPGCYGCSDRECPAYLANIVLRLWNRRPQQSAEPVAWMWQYIGKDPMADQIKPCARSLHEMDPHKPPYPDKWRPEYPLYAGNTVTVPEGESLWLIEQTGKDGVRRFWAGYFWTKNALEAARFVKSEDARSLVCRPFWKNISNSHPDEDKPVEVCEHLFQCAASPGPSELVADLEKLIDEHGHIEDGDALRALITRHRGKL